MNLKYLLLTAYLFIIQFAVFAQGNDQYGGITDYPEEDNEPFDPAGLYVIIAIIVVVYIYKANKQGNDYRKKNKNL